MNGKTVKSATRLVASLAFFAAPAVWAEHDWQGDVLDETMQCYLTNEAGNWSENSVPDNASMRFMFGGTTVTFNNMISGGGYHWVGSTDAGAFKDNDGNPLWCVWQSVDGSANYGITANCKLAVSDATGQTGNLWVKSGKYTFSNFDWGLGSTSQGPANIKQTGGSLGCTGVLKLAGAPEANYTIEAGSISVGDDVKIGEGASTLGKFTVSGANSTVTIADELWVGNGGDGIFNMSAGTLSCTDFVTARTDSSSTEFSKATITGGVITASRTLWHPFGKDRKAELTISGGNFNIAGDALIARGESSEGKFTMSGGAVDVTGQFEVCVGNNAKGRVYMTGGVITNHNYFVVGCYDVKGYDAYMEIAGGAKFVSLSENPTVIASRGGNNSKAVLCVKNGELYVKSYVRLGEIAGVDSKADATLILNDERALVDVSRDKVYISSDGSYETSVMTLDLKGGTLITKGLEYKTGNGAGYINLAGGTLKAAPSADSSFVPANNKLTAYVKTGGAIIDSNGNDITFGEPLLTGETNDGGLIKKGAGTLTLASGNTYTGATVVEAGVLAIADASPTTAGIVLQGGSVTAPGDFVVPFVEFASDSEETLPSWYATSMKLIISGDTTLVVPQGTTLGDVEFKDNGKIVYTLSTYTAGETASVGSIGTVTYPENETIANHVYISVDGVHLATVSDVNGTLTAVSRENVWIGEAGTAVDYADPAQWESGTPTGYDILVFNRNGTISSSKGVVKVVSGATVSVAQALTIDALAIGAGGGSIDTGSYGVTIANVKSVDGTLRITGGGSLTITQTPADTASFVVDDNTTLTVSSSADIGKLTLGENATPGTMEVAGGSVTITGDATFSNNDNSGNSSLVVNAGAMDVTGQIKLAQGANTQGSITVSGGALTNHNWFCVGSTGNSGYTAQMTITGGEVYNAGNLTLASAIGGHSSSTVVVSGGKFTGTGDIYIGECNELHDGGVGSASFTLSSGTVDNSNGLTHFDYKNKSVAGSTFALTITGGEYITKQIKHGTGAGTATINLGGGTLKASPDATSDFIPANNNLSIVLATGTTTTIDTNGKALTIGAAVSGTGTLRVTGGGSLALGAGMTYTGTTAVDAGTTLSLSDTSATTSRLILRGGSVSVPANFSVAEVELASGGEVALPSWYTTSMKLIISGDTTLVVPQGTTLGDVEFKDNGKIVYTLSTYTAGETASVGSIGTVTYPENETIANHIYISVDGVRTATVADTNGVLTAAPREVVWIGTGTVDYTDNTQWQGGAPTSFDIAVFNADATISSAHPAMKLTSGATLSCSGASYTFTKLVIDSTGGAIDDMGKKISFDGAVTGAGVLTKKGAGIVNFKRSSVGCGVMVDEGAFIMPAGASVGSLTIGKKGVVAVDLSAVSNALSADEGSNELTLFTATNLTFEDGDKDSLDTTVFLTGPVVSYTLNEANGTVKAEITDISHKSSTRKITTWNGGLYTGEDMPAEYHIDNNTHWSDGMPSGSAQGVSYDIAVIPGDARIFLWSFNVMSYGDLVVRHGTLNIERNTGNPEVKVRRITGVGTIVQPDSTGYVNVGDDSMTVASTITLVCEKRNNSHLWIYPKNSGSIVFNGDIDVSNGEVQMYARTVVGNIIVGSGAASRSVYLRDANSSITINGAATILDGATFDFVNAHVTFGDNASLVLKGGVVANLNYPVPALEVAGGDYVYSTLHATVENRPIMLSGGILRMTAAEAKSTEGRPVVVKGGTLVIDTSAEEITAAGQSLVLNAITSADSATAGASITITGKPFDWTVTVPENGGVVTVASMTAETLENKWIGAGEGNLEDAGNWEYGVPDNTQIVCFDKDVVANRSDKDSKAFWKKLRIANGVTVELRSNDANYPTYQLAEGIEGSGTLLLTRCGISAATQDVTIPATITIDTRNNGKTSDKNDSWLNTTDATHSITVNGPVIVQHYLILRYNVVLNGEVTVKSGAQLRVDPGTTTINGRLVFENGGTLSGEGTLNCGEQAVLEMKGGTPTIPRSAINKFSDVVISGEVTLPYDETLIAKLTMAEGGALTVDMTKVDSPVENTPVTIVTSFNGDETAVKYSDTYKWQWTFSKGEGSSLLATPVDSSVNTWTGNSVGEWENSSNWQFGVPQKGQTVKFDKNVQVLINGDKTVSTIDVASGVRVLVKSTNVGTIHPTLRPAAMTGAGTVALHHAGIIPSVAMTIPDTLTIEIEKVNDANTIDSWLEGDTSETALTINAPIIGNGYVIFRDYVVLGGDNSKYAGKVLKDDKGDIKFTSSNAASAAATWDIYCDVYTTTLTDGTLKFGALNLYNQKLWYQKSNSTMTIEVGALGQDMQFGGNYFFGTESYNSGTNPENVTLKIVGGKLTNASYGIRKMVVAGGEMVLATPTHGDGAWASYRDSYAGYQIDSLVVENGATLSGTTDQTVTSVKFEDGAYYRLTRTSDADDNYTVNSLTAANIEFGKDVYLYLSDTDRVKASDGTVLSGSVTGSPMTTVLNEAKTGIAACNSEGWYWTASTEESGVKLASTQVNATTVETGAETSVAIRDADLAAWLTANSATESVNAANRNGVTGILAYMLGAEDYTNAAKPTMGATVADGVATLTFDDSAFRRVPGLKLAYYLESCDKADFSEAVTTSEPSDKPAVQLEFANAKIFNRLCADVRASE